MKLISLLLLTIFSATAALAIPAPSLPRRGLTKRGLTVDTPAELVTCETAELAWSGGVAPYYVAIIPGGDAGASPLESFTVDATSYEWTVNLAAGTYIAIEVRDSEGYVGFSAAETIQAGTSTSCL